MSTLVNQLRRDLRPVIALSLLLGIAGCDESTPPEEEPEVVTMRLTVGTSSVEVEGGTVTGGPLMVPAGNATLTVEWLRADGTADPLVTDAEFQLNATVSNTAVLTMTRASAFSFTVNGLQSGQSTAVEFALFHLEEQHEDFGPFPVTVQVQ